MSDYTDARLPLKKDRQDIKLAKAQAKRATDPNRNDTLDADLLPSRYGPADNDPDNFTHATPPLEKNRPWKP